ncbi:MAG: ribonuclease E, partial [Hyphomicrobiaceae bacterium]
MLINAIDPEESRIAVVEDGVLQELHVELANREAYLGNIYKGKVVNIEPSIGAAFVAFGGRVNGFLHVSDVLPAYGRPDFRLEDVIEGRARVDVEDGPESMQQALSDDDDDDHDDDAAEAKSGPSSEKSGPKRGDRKPRKAPAEGDAAGGDPAVAEAAGKAASDASGNEAGSQADAAAGGDVVAVESVTRESATREPATREPVEVPSEGNASGGDTAAGVATAPVEPEAQAEVSADDGEAHADDHHDDEEDHADDGDDNEPSIEPVDSVQVVEPDPVDDDHDDDHHGGFGHGLDDERPLRMAAADPGDDADGGGDEGASASVEGASSAPAGPVRELRNEAAGDAGDDGASGTEAGSGEAGDGEAGDGEGAPRRRRSRSRRSRSRKSADRVDGDAPEGDRPDGETAEGGDVAVAPQEEKDADGEARTGARKKRSRRSGGRESSPGPGSPGSPGSSGSSASPSGGNRATNDRRVPRSNRPTIDQLLKRGQEVVVQITKEGIGTKGPTLTTYVSLPGRCLVLMPSLPKCGVSRKIEDGRERRRLKRVVKELDETGSGGIGFIVRTAGIDKSLEDVKRDRDYLKKIWEMVAQRLKVTKAPALLYQESDLVLKAMRDQFTPDIADVVVDSEDVYMRIRDFAEKLMPVMADRIKRHSVTTPLFHSFGIEKDVEELYEPQVNLSNGAS